MLHVYHESDKEENNLDSKPLLSDLKLNELIKNESKPIFVNECNWKKKNIINEKYHISLSPEIKIIDENDNLIEITEISKETIYGLYVVAFDTKYGNVIEWQVKLNKIYHFTHEIYQIYQITTSIFNFLF